MNLFINSPAYYTSEYGVCDEIYQMCSLISGKIDITKYTDLIDTIGITPIIAPIDVLVDGKWKEERKINLSYRYANISIISNYDEFIRAGIEEKKKIILKNILDSLFVIKKSLKDKLNYAKLVEDIMHVLNKDNGTN